MVVYPMILPKFSLTTRAQLEHSVHVVTDWVSPLRIIFLPYVLIPVFIKVILFVYILNAESGWYYHQVYDMPFLLKVHYTAHDVMPFLLIQFINDYNIILEPTITLI